MDVNALLDACKKASGSNTDGELAKKLGLSKKAMSSYRNNARLPDPVVCATIAGLSGIPLAKVLGIVGEARAISREEKAVWRKLAATAVVLLCAIGLSMATPEKAHAFNNLQASLSGQISSDVYYVQSRARYYWDLAKLRLYGIGRKLRDSLSRHMEATA